MRQKLEQTFSRLENNSKNYVVFYKQNRKVLKRWNELSSDIDRCIRKISSILDLITCEKAPDFKIAIIGPTSYDWMVVELACLKAGFYLIGIPEHLKEEDAQELLDKANPDLTLVDFSLNQQLASLKTDKLVYYNCYEERSDNFSKVDFDSSFDVHINVQSEYGAGFTSGTTLNIKKVNLSLWTSPERDAGIIKKARMYFNYLFSFWSRRDNKIIIFMPFSHAQQRTLLKTALVMKINIVISDPVNCIRHIILEKPNIMVSVPLVYDFLAQKIEYKLKQFNGGKKRVFKFFKSTGLNKLSNRNPLKKLVSDFLFKDIRKIYGGKASYFIVGSAKVSTRTVDTFYQVGAKILEAYGQTETGIIAMNSHRHFKIGSVGKPNMKVKIVDDGEILVKSGDDLHQINRGILNIDSEGYIHTGDVGYLDDQGYLFLNGRKDEVIVLKNGKKLHPVYLEEKLNEESVINHSIVCNYADVGISAILSVTDLANIDAIRNIVVKVNSQIPDYENINNFHLTTDKWSTENGLLTNTFKVKRKMICEKYAAENFYKVHLNIFAEI